MIVNLEHLFTIFLLFVAAGFCISLVGDDAKFNKLLEIVKRVMTLLVYTIAVYILIHFMLKLW